MSVVVQTTARFLVDKSLLAIQPPQLFSDILQLLEIRET